MSEVVDKRRVVMHNPETGHTATDFVPMSILDAYVADAQTRWPSVTVGTEHDPGPGGDEGLTNIPPHLIGD